MSRLLVRVLILTGLVAVTMTGASGVAGPSASVDPVGVWPLQPRPEVVRRFDPPETWWGPGHRGVDLLGFPGKRVRAALAGRVTFAGVLAGRGVVVVSHGDTRTTYEPVTAFVDVGERIGRGQAIGTLAYFGSHCLPRACLHWGWRRGETYLDPLRLVGAGPVRLLPLWRDEPAGVAVANPYSAVLRQLARFARSPRAPL